VGCTSLRTKPEHFSFFQSVFTVRERPCKSASCRLDGGNLSLLNCASGQDEIRTQDTSSQVLSPLNFAQGLLHSILPRGFPVFFLVELFRIGGSVW
jgi:hypothetical protein